MTDLQERAVKNFNTIFSNKTEVELEEGTYRIGKTRGGLLSVTMEDIFYIVQNPNKNSRWAKQAQAGHQIMWGLRGRTYILQVVDGVFTRLKNL